MYKYGPLYWHKLYMSTDSVVVYTKADSQPRAPGAMEEYGC